MTPTMREGINSPMMKMKNDVNNKLKFSEYMCIIVYTGQLHGNK